MTEQELREAVDRATTDTEATWNLIVELALEILDYVALPSAGRFEALRQLEHLEPEIQRYQRLKDRWCDLDDVRKSAASAWREHLAQKAAEDEE